MRWIIRAILGLAVLGLVGIAALLLLPAERIADLVESRFQQATGRTLVVEGDVRPTLWPSLGVTTGKVVIANASWSKAGPMLRAESLSIAVDPMALLSGDIRISAVHAEAPDILLEIRADGMGNWDMSPEGAAAETTTAAGGLPPVTIDRATIRRGALRLVDHRTGADRRLSALDATLVVPSMQGSTTFDLTALVNGQATRLSGSIEGLGAFLNRGAVPMTADLSVGIAKAGFSGRAGLTPPAASGRLSADLANLAPVMAALGQGAVTLPRGLGRDRVAVVGDVTFTDGTLNLRDATLTLDTNTLAGAADLSLKGARPAINARLSTGALDLSGLSSGETGARSAATGWSRDPIDVSAIKALDARLALSATSVRIGKTPLGRTDLYTTLDAGRAVTEIREIEAFGGRFAGSWVLNSRGGLSTRLALDGSALAIAALLNELLGFDRLVASGNLSLDLLGVGNSLHAIMTSLKGSGRFATGAGELLGFDLVGMLRTLDPKFIGKSNKTIFDKVSASFTVENGVLRNADLSLLAPLIAAKGSGEVGLGARDLNYRLMPRLLGEQGITVPILITGPWDAPRIKLDLEGLAKDKLDAEGKRLEQKAKAAALERLEEKLGVPLETSRDVERALKRELETEAKKGLLKLLQGN